MRCWGQQLDDKVYEQIKARENLIGSENKTIEQLQYLNSNTAWAILRSGVNIGNSDNSELAKKYVLCGGAASAAGVGFVPRTGIDFSVENPESEGAYGLTTGFGFRPMPGITSVSITQKDVWGTIREAKISFQVWSLQDFDAIDKLYFKPGFTVLLEYGHTYWLDNNGKVNPIDIGCLVNNGSFFGEHRAFAFFENAIAEKRKEYQQNYQGFIGYITNFNYSFNDKGGYDCSITMLSKGSVIRGMTIAAPTKSSENSDTKQENQEDIGTTAFHAVLNAFDSVYGSWNNRHLLTLGNVYILTKNEQKDNYLAKLNLSLENSKLKEAKVLKYNTKHCKNSKSTRKNNTYFMSLGTLLEIINRFNLAAYEKQGENKQNTVEINGIKYILTKSKINFISGYNQDMKLKSEESAKFITFPAHFSLDPLTAVLTTVPEKGVPVDSNIASEFKFEKNSIMSISDVVKTNKEKKEIVGDLPAIESLGSSDILNICIDYNAFLAELDAYIETKPERYYLDDVLKSFLSRVQKALGNINSFEIVPCFSKAGIEYLSVVDTNYIPPVKEGEELKRLYGSGLKSTFHSLKASSEISVNMVNTISVAANGTKGCSSDLIKWNDGCYNRHVVVGPEEQDDETNKNLDSGEKPTILLVSGSKKTSNGNYVKEENVTYEKNALIEFCKNMSRYYEKLAKGDGGKGEEEISNSEELATANQVAGEDLFNQFVRVSSIRTAKTSESDGVVPACGVLPIKVECTMKGLGGFVVGETFGLQPGTLPDKYDDWGYIITGVSEEINSSGWKTTLKTQYFPAKVKVQDNIEVVENSQNENNYTLHLNECSMQKQTSVPLQREDDKKRTTKDAVKAIGPNLNGIYGGKCAKYATSMANYYKNGSSNSAGLDADSSGMSKAMKGMGYTEVINKNFTGTCADLKKKVNELTLEDGDVIQYWSDEIREEHSEKGVYRHMAFNSYGVWYSDTQQPGPVVYNGKGEYSWHLRVYRA